jgi:hypothetical protein
MKKLTLVIVLLISSTSLFANELVKFSIENRRVQSDDYLIDIMAEPTSGNWLVGNCNIIIKFNPEALSLEGLENEQLFNQGLMTKEDGYKVDQTNYENNMVSLNIFNMEPTEYYNTKQIVGTLRFKIVNPANFDNLEFETTETEIFDNWTLLEYNRKDSKGYTVVNPSPVAPNNLSSGIIEGNSESLLVSPLPADEEFTLEIQETISITATIEIINNAGKTVYTGTPTGNVTKINCKDLAAGAYIVILKDGNKVYQEKLIVQ